MGRVLAVVTYPVAERLSLRFGPGRAAAPHHALSDGGLIVPAVALAVAFAREALDLAGSVQQAFTDGRFAWIARAWADLQRRLPVASTVDPTAVSADALRNGAAFLFAQSGAIFRNVAGFALNLILALFTTFFFLRDAGSIMEVIRRLLPMSEDEREELITRTRDLISAGVTSAVIVAGLQGLLGGISFALVGLDAPVFGA